MPSQVTTRSELAVNSIKSIDAQAHTQCTSKPDDRNQVEISLCQGQIVSQTGSKLQQTLSCCRFPKCASISSSFDLYEYDRTLVVEALPDFVR